MDQNSAALSLAMPIVTVALLAGFVGGCDRKVQPTANRYSTVIQTLNNFRRGFAQTPEADPNAIGRIDHITAILKDEIAFEGHGYLVAASLGHDEDVSGADLCRLTGVARIGAVQRVEFLGKDRKVVVVCPEPLINWGAKDSKGEIGDFQVVFYVTPSVFDSPSAPLSPGVKEGLIDGTFKIKVVKLPVGAVATDCSVRLIFSSGDETDAIKIWKYQDQSQSRK